MINSGWMDKLFQKKLQNFEMQVNPHVWETIAKNSMKINADLIYWAAGGRSYCLLSLFLWLLEPEHISLQSG